MTRAVMIAGLAGFAVMGLVACSKTGSTTSGSAAPAQAPAAASNSGPVTLSSMPHRKDGLWEQSMTTAEGGPSFSTRICTDSTVEARLGVAGQRLDRSKCANYSVNRQLNGDYVFSSTCNLGGAGGTVTSNGVMHSDGDSAYHMDLDSKTTGSSIAQMNVERKMTLEGKWLGPCPPGQKPGDMMINGMKVNILSGSSGGPAAGG